MNKDFTRFRKIKGLTVLAALVVVFFLPQLTACSSSENQSLDNQTTVTASSTRISKKHQWAKPLKGPGLSNFYRVTKDLYRGAQPTSEGMRHLKKMGIRTIINLRAWHSDRDEIGDTGLEYVHIHMTAFHPEDEDVVQFLRIVTNKDRTPVFVHCEHGSDRTGMMVAIYRVVVSGWTKEEAIREMTQGGFGFHEIHQNLVEYIRNLDIDEIKQKVEKKN